jgi:hypothetical protein
MKRDEFALNVLITDANDIVAGNTKRRWLWFGIPPAEEAESHACARWKQ